MSRSTAMRLVKSLSKSEKRQFKLLAKKQSGARDYLDLFDIIDRYDFTQEQSIDDSFQRLHPGSSINNAASYLVKVLTDSLIHAKIKEDPFSQLLYGLLRVNILNERNLSKEGFKELKRLQQIASSSTGPLIEFTLLRYELDYYSATNFCDLTENQLIETQMKTRQVLRDTRNTLEHYSLYELLKFRLIHSGKTTSEDDKTKFTDLLLSEMSIVNAKVRNNLESRKVHLLFQSFFFTNTGDYASALKTFQELNRLFEKNEPLWRQPPLDYFSALDGILDNLRVIGRYKEMLFYVEKLQHLDNDACPEYFRFVIRKSVTVYHLTILLNTGELKTAEKLIQSLDPDLLKAYSLADEEKQYELLFFIALTWFKLRDLKKAHKSIHSILLVGNINQTSLIYKATRLLNILIHYEEKDLEYLDYEIRSYRRPAKGNKPTLLSTEKLVFKAIKINPDFNQAHKNAILWNTIKRTVATTEKDKYEIQIRKYFDFIGWIKNKFGEAGSYDAPEI